MNKKTTSCFNVSDTPVQCPCCKGFRVVKNGFTKTKKQQYYCKACGKRFLETYTYHAYRKDINEDIVALTKEGMGVRSTARFLKISATTLLKRIIAIAQNIKQPPVLALFGICNPELVIRRILQILFYLSFGMRCANIPNSAVFLRFA